MSSQAAMLAREIGISNPEGTMQDDISWEDWINREEQRRTLRSPSTCQHLVLNGRRRLLHNASIFGLVSQRPFQQTLDQPFSGVPIHREGPISAFGNYALIHGLLQQIFFERNASSCPAESTDSLCIEFVKKMESALRGWQESWEATHESTLNPSSPKGPLGFNSTALLRLAYIRLNANLGPNRQLITRDPMRIAHAFTNGKIHVIAQCVEAAGIDTLRDDERKLLNMIASLVRETNLADTLDRDQEDASRIRRLPASTMRLWAETFKGFHVFEIVHVGASLSHCS